MRILGVSAFYHDSAAALLIDGDIHCAVQQERLSRIKHDSTFPSLAIDWCLERGGISADDLDAVVFYEKPFRKLDRILVNAIDAFPNGWRVFPHILKNLLSEKLWVAGVIAAELGVRRQKILFTSHHESHAAAAFLASPTFDAAIVTVDGVGEWATATVSQGRRTPDGACSIELLQEIRFPHSLGMLYSTFTAYLGFEVNDGEYKVMGLAAYGRPTCVDVIRRMVEMRPDGSFALDLDYFEFHRSVRSSYSQRLVSELGAPRNAALPIDLTSVDGQRYADIAASVQQILGEAMVGLARAAARATGAEDLCLGGGVALNGCANVRVLQDSGFRRVFVPPSPGDSGCAIGAALYADRIHFGCADRLVGDHSYWGPSIDPEELQRLAREDGLVCECFALPDLIEFVARRIAEGAVVAWTEGRCEFGPRALGHRSLLANALDATAKDRLNRFIKRREDFRPFAPSVPADRLQQYFCASAEGARLARFMSGVFPVRAEWRDRLRAVTHVDGTARVQAVHEDIAPNFYALLHAVERHVGVPIVLNTSLNIAGEPIAATIAEAYSTFRRGPIDFIVAAPYVVHQSEKPA